MPDTVNILGIDGNSPILDTGRWTTWSISDVYMGSVGLNKYIPKVNDHVVDPETFTTYIVDSIDPVTYVPTLRKIVPNMVDGSIQPEYLIAPPGVTQSDSYRVYLDTGVTPHILAVDSRLKVAGSMSSYAKIFKGSDLGGSGTVISRMYDSQGQDLGENIPLETVALDNSTNYAIKSVPPCRTNEKLLDGEVVTIVIYSDNGHVVSKQQCLVENTNFIRGLNPLEKSISHIELSTAYLSKTDPTLIEFPVGTPIESLPMMGIVHYTDGSTLRLPVNGDKFIVYGLDQYVASTIGQRITLVLTYKLSPEEKLPGSTDNVITKEYTLITMDVDNSYKVMIQSYPEWKGPTIGYIPRHFLLTADRNGWWDITDKVTFEENYGPYSPSNYGVIQKKALTVNLKDVDPTYKDFNHVQRINYLLESPPDGMQSNWQVDMVANGDTLSYGKDLYAKKPNGTVETITVDSDITDVNAWLDRVYYKSDPVVDTAYEDKPPRPTHFVVMYKGEEVMRSIAEYTNLIRLSNSVDLYDNIYLRFVRLDASGNEITLGISGLQIVAA